MYGSSIPCLQSGFMTIQVLNWVKCFQMIFESHPQWFLVRAQLIFFDNTIDDIT